MAIGSNILYVDSATKKVKEIYNHQSSHLMYTGRVLYEFYKDQSKVEKLIDNGDVYCIGYTTDPIPKDKQNDEVYRNGNNHCTYYVRDLAKPQTKHTAREYDDLNHALEALEKGKLQQFTYIWKDGKWYYRLWKRRVEEMIPVRIFHDDEEDG